MGRCQQAARFCLGGSKQRRRRPKDLPRWAAPLDFVNQKGRVKPDALGSFSFPRPSSGKEPSATARTPPIRRNPPLVTLPADHDPQRARMQVLPSGTRQLHPDSSQPCSVRVKPRAGRRGHVTSAPTDRGRIWSAPGTSF
jgi:hypothetical protein